MILTTLPDLAPRPQTAANAEFRRRFYARWGRENAVVCGRAVQAEYAVHAQTLSVKLAAGGRERYFLARREVVVDDDNYLVLDEGARYGSELRAALPAGTPAWSFAIFFRPGLQHEVAAARRQTLAEALDAPDTAPGRAATAGFAEHLRPHGGAVSRHLRHIAHAVAAGQRDETWLEEQCTALLDAMFDAEAGARLGSAAHSSARAAARVAQRTELRRRLHLAADFIESHFTEALRLDHMAEAACLSRYHFVREFSRAFGLSPHAWLTRKRARAALRALRAGATDRDEVAMRCGFGSRWSLTRALARHDEGRSSGAPAR